MFSLLFTIWQCFYLFIIIYLPYSQAITTTQFVLSTPGTQFIPASMSAQLISITSANSINRCAISCSKNFLCRVFDYEVFASKQCRLFEGDINTQGQIVLSSSSLQSRVGIIQLSPSLFIAHGLSCSSFCHDNRYLQCSNNFTCECRSHTYWNASISMCVAQSPIMGAPCQQNASMCRQDLNYTCLQFDQCGLLSVLSGRTVMNSTTVISGTSSGGSPDLYGIVVLGTDTDSVVVSDTSNNRVVTLWNVGTTYQNNTVVASEWAPGQTMSRLRHVYVDTRNGSNLYACDYDTNQVILFTSMQSISPPPRVVAGTTNSSAVGLRRLNGAFGVQVDSHHNVIVSCYVDHRIIFWPFNSSSGIVIAGLGTASNTPMGLNSPQGIVLDEYNSWLYVADTNNHRIQRYSLNDSWPCNGTTVAGGNGPGSGNHQLNGPSGIWISKKAGALYIADTNNHRIQKWQQQATEGVTIAGDPNGNPGSSSTQLHSPVNLAFNTNETRMYVVDQLNYRVQRFQLI